MPGDSKERNSIVHFMEPGLHGSRVRCAITAVNFDLLTAAAAEERIGLLSMFVSPGMTAYSL